MKNLNLALIMVSLVSCAHLQEPPKMVQFQFASELLEKVQKVAIRMPASIDVSELSEKSPRRVYFSSLYHQYLTIGQHLGEDSDINFCPQFHHDKIETDSSLIPKVSFYPNENINPEGRNYFPELAFSKKFSLSDYHKVIKSELVTLCEEGVSDNFYKFDNLITHYSNKRSFHQDPKAMVSVLKIPVFANFYLVKMLETPGFNVTSPEEKRFITLSQTHWFEKYVSEASQIRNKFITNKMVQR